METPTEEKRGPGRPTKAAVLAAQAPRTLTVRPTARLTLLACGTGDYGELGIGTSPPQRSAPKAKIIPTCDPAKPGTFSIVQVAVGGMHTVCLTSKGRIITWGVNDKCALGRDTSGWTGGAREIVPSDGSSSSSNDSESDDGELNPLEATPTMISISSFDGESNFTSVAAGNNCSFAVTSAGDLWGWGSFLNREGKSTFYPHPTSPTGFVTTQPTPTKIPHLPPIVSISVGTDHVLALTSTSQLYAWGVGEQSQFGRRLRLRSDFATVSSAPMPRRVELFRRAPRMGFSGPYHAFAIDERDNVWSWGLNSYGQTGDVSTVGTTESASFNPSTIPSLRGKRVIMVAGGGHHSVAVTESGEAYVWGRMDGGQLGIKFTAEELNDQELIVKDGRGKPRICLQPTLVRIEEEEESRLGRGRGAAASKTATNSKWHQPPKFVHASCSAESTILLTDKGVAYGTGFNTMGQLGLGHEVDVEVFTRLKTKSVRSKKLVWAGCGGQFSILAYPAPANTAQEEGNEEDDGGEE
ncbi:Regulator of chromosome condensation/beta-lactamase-inhibitor protein II [Zalerion maritima]|uniref:Regulator of chromosome condensation/beta-lactamase-inhibitor protein II n=1 Tax=Zalerion maritima TaxID=339359 RepID=A0AAD5RKM5_9PEZI|nr:Regulator of chromosome condensation/beta-lactamase-inhibitor protein II [Zalerion maritima]